MNDCSVTGTYGRLRGSGFDTNRHLSLKFKKMIIIPEKVRFEPYSYIYTLKGINLDYSLQFIPFRVYICFMNTISEFIKRERKKAGLTQEEFALRAGLGLRFVRELEQGKETVRMDKVNQALRMFGMEAVPGPLTRGDL